MELTPKLNEKVMAAISKALKGLSPRPAVDRIVTARTSGKWTHYVQVLLAYSPKEFGLAYVNLDKPSEPKVKVHDAKSKAGRFATAKELKRLAKAEKRLERAEKAEPKAKVTPVVEGCTTNKKAPKAKPEVKS